MVHFREPHQFLNNPGGGIPFGRQGYPIPDPLQKHMSQEQWEVVSKTYAAANRLPLGRFLGTNWHQDNQPQFLGANERINFGYGW